ncbi:MAG: carboxylate-amine ligase [Acidobacteriota bacterium]|nr:carboxylate-amine ligase [Acidobacteriota bacterium]MDH3785038.1 carboxylate-amine ligase [Acidobacteriota bacterium]
MSLPDLTIGIEEEYQIIHPETRELTSYIQEFLDEGRVILRDQIKPEFLTSQIEVGSSICSNMREARAEIARLRRTVIGLAKKQGLRVAAAGTHPFSQWSQQKVTAGERYTRHEQDMADVARQMLVFGMHVHVGIDDPELRVDVMNQSRYFMPHLLALSTSSPFWHGRDTGLRSYRTIILGNLPRSGLPPSFNSWAEHEQFIDTLLRTRCIDEATKIWWDIRLNPKYPTVEFRYSDICTRIDEVMCIAALQLAIVAKLIKLHRANLSWRDYRRNLLTENKWRAARYGIEGSLIDFGSKSELPVRELVHEILALVDDVVDELQIRDEVDYVHTILERGTSADRQLAVYKETGSLEAVVDRVIEETETGIDDA